MRVAVAQEAQDVEWSSTYQMVDGSIPGIGSLHIQVALGKTLNPKLIPMLCHLCVSLCEWLKARNEQVEQA